MGVYAQRYDASGVAVGGELLVNTYTTSWQSNPSAGIDDGGNFAIAYESNDQDGFWSGVFVRRYDSTATPLGAETQVNTFTAEDQIDASLAMAGSGDFVVTWTSFSQDSDGSRGVYAQSFDATGVAVGSEFHVSTTISGRQEVAAVAINDAGQVAFAWQGEGAGDVDGIPCPALSVSRPRLQRGRRNRRRHDWRFREPLRT